MPDAVAIIHVRLLRRIVGVGRPDAEHAIDAADDAANRAADHRADRAGGVVAHIGAMGDAVGNALRLCRERRNQRCGDNGGCEHNLELHVENPFLMSRSRHMSRNEGDRAAIAWRRSAAAAIRGACGKTITHRAHAAAGTLSRPDAGAIAGAAVKVVTSAGCSWCAPSWFARWHSARAAGLGPNVPCPW